MYNERAKLIGGVLVSVLITTIVMVPTSIFVDRAINGVKSNIVQTYGYDDQISSTAKKINGYMGIDFQDTINHYNPSKPAVSSGEPTITMNNPGYHSMTDDIYILDGVDGVENGLGYLTTSWILGYEGSPFKILKIFDKDNHMHINDELNKEFYLNPTLKEDQKEYSKISVNESETLSSTLNAHLKVTKDVADWLRPSIGTKKLLNASNGPESFINYLNTKGYVDDFIVEFALFNYMAYDISNIVNINETIMNGTNSSGIYSFDKDYYDFLNNSYKSISNSNAELKDVVDVQQNKHGNLYDINIDGTGTDSGILKLEIDNFSNAWNEITDNNKIGNKTIFNYNLDNGGSGEGWRVPSKDKYSGIANPGSKETNARGNAFIGTQSRAPKNKDMLENWGYKSELDAQTTNDVYLDPHCTKNGDIIGYTMGIDLPSFFIKNDTKFKYKIKSNNDLIAIENSKEKDLKIGDIVTLSPTGLSNHGAKRFYQYGDSWSNVMSYGLMLAEVV